MKNYFQFYPDLTKDLSLECSVLFCFFKHLFYVRRKSMEYIEIGDDIYIRATVYDVKSKLNIGQTSQLRYLRILEKNGYLSVRELGSPPRRYISIKRNFVD